LLYTLTGFTHDLGFRVFAFEGIGEDRVRSEYRVRADLALTRRYGIRLQELPLLCRNVLERHDPSDQNHTLTYSEAEMSLYASVCAARLRAPQARKEHTKGLAGGEPRPV
jgi:hypothetical protein